VTTACTEGQITRDLQVEVLLSLHVDFVAVGKRDIPVVEDAALIYQISGIHE
jgi:NCAIR mutase (PurE)-related protein